MPKKARSKKQKHFLQAVEHSPSFAKEVGMKPSVAEEMLHPRRKKSRIKKK